MDILEKIKNIKFNTVDVDAHELGEGCTLRVRELSGCEQLEFHNMLQAKGNTADVKALAYALMCALVDEDGNAQLKTQDESEKLLRALPGKLFQRLNRAIFDLNNGEHEKN